MMHSFYHRFINYFISSPITVLLLLALFITGIIAINNIPREEEPQISVPMVDIFLNANGLKAEDAVELVTKPLEAIIKAIPDVEHVYSQTEDDKALVTARFKVGTNADNAILRVHEKIRGHLNEIPYGIEMPLIVNRGIDDVAILTLTLVPSEASNTRWDRASLYQLALKLQHEMIKIEDVGHNYIVGGAPNQIQITLLPEKLMLYGVSLNQVV